MAQRLSRVRVRIKATGIPYHVPDPADLPARADEVMQVIYLIFNEGYLASSGDTLLRRDQSTEAIRLGQSFMTDARHGGTCWAARAYVGQ